MGWAFGDTASLGPTAGTVCLATKQEISSFGKTRQVRTGDPRIFRMQKWLSDSLSTYRPDVVAFEDVQFQSYTNQTQLWSSYRTTLWLGVNAAGIPVTECVPVTSLKLFATCCGNADKSAMFRALQKKHPQIKVVGDDAIDAVWIWLWAKETLSRR